MSEKFAWMDKLFGHVPGIRAKLLGAKFIIGTWDHLSDDAKLEMANAAVEKIKEWGNDDGDDK